MRRIRRARIHAGSSPLARGTREIDEFDAWEMRLIPARAGNTGIAQRCQREDPAHPRSRGEHGAKFAQCCPPFGSSPLARGTPYYGELVNIFDRLIPARAGNTDSGAGALSIPAAHPRSRGEHRMTIQFKDATGGSSPLARGTLTDRAPSVTAVRLIPARAGNTRRSERR